MKESFVLSLETVMTFAREHHLPYFKTSAKTGYGIRRVIRYSLKKAHDKLVEKEKVPTPAT